MDLIYRERAIKEIRREVSEQESNAIQGEDLDVGVIVGLKMAVRIIKEQPSAEKTGKWIPVTERLPEEDKEVLISYRYKEGEGDTSHADIDITTYGQMYFGGNKVGNNKHWRAPFEYFYSNYEVIAWMPLPEPYKGQANCGARMENDNE